MAVNPQFKVNKLAKDLGVKGKDLTDILSAKGFEVKSQATLEPAAFDVLFETLTKENQITGIEDYLDGVTYIPSKPKPKAEAKPVPEAPAKAAPAPAAENTSSASGTSSEKTATAAEKPSGTPAEKSAEKPADKSAESAAKSSVEGAETGKKTAEATAPKAETPAPEKAAQAPAEQPVKTEPHFAPPRQAGIHSISAREIQERASRLNPQAAGSSRPQNTGRTGAPQTGNRPGQFGSRPNNAGASYGNRQMNGGNGSFGGQRTPGGASSYGNRPAGNTNAGGYNNNGASSFGAGRQGSFGSGNGSFGAPRTPGTGFGGSRPAGSGFGGGFGGPKPQQKKSGRPGQRPGQRFGGDKEDYQPGAPKERYKAQPIIRGASTGPVERGATRVVDTRGGADTVDLSKYDEKLNTFVSDRVSDLRGGSERFHKNIGNNHQNRKNNQRRGQSQQPVVRQQLNVQIPDEIQVSELAQRLKVTAATVVKQLIQLGVMATLNEVIDFDTASLVAEALGAKVTKEVVVTIEEKLFGNEDEDPPETLEPRAPVVCVMGHVDHGKTSILDAIRHTSVTSGEAGGITQHIGAYRVKVGDRDITFLDTPGHEAFTAMRARGAMATDIAILVVAADDGIMPQTVEAINHAKAAGVDIIVAINKMDKPGANPERIKEDLTRYELVPEEWGGDVICVPVSAKTGEGIQQLLESVLLVADVHEFKANPNRRAQGVIIEARLDKGRGPIATVLVQKGTLHNGDIVIAGTAVGRVRSMTDHNGKPVKTAGPSVPVELAGLDGVPTAGDEFRAVEDERMARTLADRRKASAKEEVFKANRRASLADLETWQKDSENGDKVEVKNFNIIVKADVDGSVEAVKQSLLKLSNEEVQIHIIHAATGGITEGDVTFAAASNAIIIGFNVRPDKVAMDSAERQGVEIRTYRVIYDCINEITAAMKGMLAPKYRENLLGRAEVRQTIHVSSVGTVAGCYVLDGKVARNAQIRVVRDGAVIAEDKLASLKRFKDDAKEVAEGYECGIVLEKFNDIKIGDVLEAFVMEEIEQ